MRKNVTFWLVIVLSACALAASASLLVDYIRPAPVFCGADGGCGVVKRTIFAYPLASYGIALPMPAIGIAGVLAVALLALVPGRRARLAQASLALAGGLVAGGLIAVQWLLKTVCPFCAVVDGAALLVAALSIARLVRGSDPPSSRKVAAGSAAGLFAAILIPLGVGWTKAPIPRVVPPAVAAELAKTPPKKVTVIDFADFECPFCRMTHAELAPLLAANKDKVRLVRKHVPLRMHAHALDAARAGLCGEELGKGEAMADRLFAVEPTELTPEGCEKIATELGIDLEAFRACVKSPATEAHLKEDRKAFDEMVEAAGGQGGLPTLWFQREKLEGAQDAASLREALARATREL